MNKITVCGGVRTGLGLASNTYKQVLRSGELTLKELIAWAAGRGFSWVEVRDPDVEMTEEALLDTLELANRLGVRLHYSWDNPDASVESEQFYKAMENAALFGKDTCCRVLLAPNLVKGKKGYSKEAMESILPVVKAYVERSKKLGIHLCFENSFEPIKGDGESYFGMSELLEACPGMCTTLDAANATNKDTLVNPTEEDLLAYYRRFPDRIFYYHLKVTKNHVLLDTIERDGDFSVDRLFDVFSTNADMNICLEIPQQPNLEQMTAAVERSLVVLAGIKLERP